MQRIRVVLVGNPNVGKTSLLNHLAGTNLKIGNWPGVTVEKREGKTLFQDYEIEFVDLPGVYTLEKAFSEDEAVTLETLRQGDFDVILQVIESPRLERDLFLTTQLCELQKPMLIALNMSDEAEALGIHINDKRFSELLKIKVLKTIGRTGQGVRDLLPAILETYEKGLLPRPEFFTLQTQGELPKEEKAFSIVKGLYAEITTKSILPKRGITEVLDQVFLHPVLGFPFLFLILYLTFKFVFDLSSPLVDFIEGFFQDFLEPSLLSLLDSLKAPPLLKDFLTGAVLGGLGIVLSFLPLIMIMFFALTLLETSGYLPRVAFLMDRFTHKIGLHGQSVIPLILGFGCNVPAILATRTIQDKKDRLLIMAMIPFMSCSARLVVFGFFALTFFEKPALLIFALYLIGIILAFITSLILRKTLLKKELSHFIMDLPPYRIPSLRVLFSIVFLHVKRFVLRAGTVIFAIAIGVWLLLNLPYGERDLEKTLAGKIGKTLSPVFEPIGLGDWRITTSLIPAFLAREAILSNLAVILKAEKERDPKEKIETDSLRGELKGFFTKASALSFLLFVLVYNSCVATFVTMWKEGSRGMALGFLLYSFILAWSLAFGVYNVF
jgi:ferrous iron transport protein B